MGTEERERGKGRQMTRHGPMQIGTPTQINSLSIMAKVRKGHKENPRK